MALGFVALFWGVISEAWARLRRHQPKIAA
jgi:cytochrome b